VAVVPVDSGALSTWQGTRRFPMYSTAKVPIMLSVLDRTLREGRQPSAWEQRQISAMIQVSDNDAATALYISVGGARGVEQYLRRIGLNQTRMNASAWGESTTTAEEMAQLLAQLGSCRILVPHLCQYALEQMRQVVPSQRWGVGKGVPTGTDVALKNGWYPEDDGWGVHSVGLVAKEGRQYAIAVFTQPDPSLGYGITTIEQIVGPIYGALP
jgi:beta-lactamase class A